MATLAALGLVLVTAAALPAPAAADAVWLCRPGLERNPCKTDLTTTVYEPSGESRVEAVRLAQRRIDCFYVYPTVSNQPTANANRSRDPELVSIARYQAAPFSARCRVFAPIYRQRTLLALATAGIQDEERSFALAFADVHEAWREYLRRDNRGRGIVLIGHSQGTRMLRLLIRAEIDRRRAVRRRIVSAILLGGNVTVAAGSDRGGDFRNVPLCARRGQTGCVVAYSTFAEDPPAEPRFGDARRDAGSGLPSGPGYEIACTDPGRLAGAIGPMRLAFPSEPFAPGLILAGTLITYGGTPPTASTPWVVPGDRWAGRCMRVGRANVLRYRPLGDSRELNDFPDESWGTHLVDVNITLDRLLEIVRIQTRRYCARVNSASGRCRAPSGRVSER